MISHNPSPEPRKQEIDPVWVLGPDGPVAAAKDHYEKRPEQLHLTRHIDRAFEQGYHLVAEAGTGIGKSYAYLIPAIKWALQSRRKTVISTHTISLQEQLIRKDIPIIHKCLGVDFVAILAKGRSNYLCLRRLQQARQRGATLFDTAEHFETLEYLSNWVLDTRDGSLSDLAVKPPGDVWEMVCSDKYACPGKQCSHQDHCFYQIARRRIYSADIIVANHALVFSDLALKQQGGKVLPNFGMVVLDEAHNIENVASKHFGLRVSNYQLFFMLNRLFNTRTHKGILAGLPDERAITLIGRLRSATQMFYDEVMGYYDEFAYARDSDKGNGRIRETGVFNNVLSMPLAELGNRLRELAKTLSENDSQRLEVESYAMRCMDFSATIQGFITQQLQEHVYWVESSQRPANRLTQICAAPLHIGPILQKTLFEPCRSVIMTSATISTRGQKCKAEEVMPVMDEAQKRGFEFFTSRLGLKSCEAIQLGSPFDYCRQVKVYVAGNLPLPREDEDAFLEKASRTVKHFLRQTMGKAFVLFTNFKQLNAMADNLEGFCQRHDLTLLVQGRDLDRSRLLHKFQEDVNSVLLGTDSFWQGVDVPGETLSNVIIVKLPFSVPDHPLLQGRLEQIEANGGSGFFDYQLPEAILKFKQGFGRLIRTAKDQGIVVILDPRVVRKQYGRAFLQALPDCEVEIIRDEEY